jgi:fumarylacetoacetase
VLAAAQALDLSVLAEHGLFAGFDAACFAEGSLNTFMGLGREAWDETRAVATRLLDAGEGELRDNAGEDWRLHRLLFVARARD